MLSYLEKNINKNNKLNNKIKKNPIFYRPHNHNFSYPLKFEDLEIVFGGREVFSTWYFLRSLLNYFGT
jgi:hypothetical protein